MTTTETTPPAVADLERDGALSAHQATRLLKAWPHLGDDWAASPYFGTVREHTRAYIDRLRPRSTDADGQIAVVLVAEVVR